MIDLKLKAKAIVAVRRRKKLEEEARIALEARESLLIERMLEKVTVPRGQDGSSGRDGTDAPTMQEILAELTPLLPESTHTETTVVQEVNPTDMEVFIKGLLPEIQPEDRPAVEQITNTIDVSDEKLEGFVSKKEFKKTLEKIQDAITASQSSGGGGSRGDLVNVIQVTETQSITAAQLLVDKYNVILVMTAGITITLPVDTGTKIIEIKQGFVGTGTYTICKETS